MKILHLCPLWFPVSHDSRGGIETLLAQLAPALTRLGCESTLIASGDSRTASQVISAVPRALCDEMEIGKAAEYAWYEQRQLQLALRHAPGFDLIHSHIGPSGYALSAVPGLRNRVLHTVHSPVLADLQWFVSEHRDYRYSTVSEYQARKIREAGATSCRAIHNGIDFERFTFRPHSGDGLLFIGRMEAVKGPDIAARVASKLGRPLTLAGPIVEHEFFQRCVVPLLDDQITYAGVVDHRQKNELFGRAACAILPFRGEEPFGLVAIEAMACGTPVVSLAVGALPEIIETGVTGHLSDNESEDDIAALVDRAIGLDRASIRARAAARFNISLTAAQYAQLYSEIAADAMQHADSSPVTP
ncbi:MAG: glycosyltransferase [Gemmatimonadaceae bacterium]|nr:glycosyltransferase [Gemmatimonadaceae bacterium]